MTRFDSKSKPSLWQVITSVLAAIFGVQSDKKRKRDFTHGNPTTFIAVGIIMVILLVLLLFGLVKLILFLAIPQK